MKKVSIRIVILAVLIIALLATILLLSSSPRADVVGERPDPDITLVDGIIVDGNNNPIKNLTIVVGSKGTQTNAKGEFSLLTRDKGRVAIQFFDALGIRYELIDSDEQVITLSPIDPKPYSFKLEKSPD